MALCSDEELEAVERALPKSQDATLSALRKAVDETLELRRATASFRIRCFRCREVGALPNVVESWYVQRFAPICNLDSYPTSLVERNPYARFKEQNPSFNAVLYSKLDFLLDDVLGREPVKHLEFGEREDDPVVNELVVALSEGELDSLIQPSPYLKHDENVAIAVLDARLWLNHSRLPIVLGERLSYADLRARADDLNKVLVRDRKPSNFYVSLREDAVWQYYSKTKTPQLVLYYPAPEDFPEQDSYWARLSRVRYPHLRPYSISASKFAAQLSKSCVAGKEEVEQLLEDLETNEMNNTYRVLAGLLFDKMVESSGSFSQHRGTGLSPISVPINMDEMKKI